ncbi:hypothetical protein N7539_003649 [Penicillium diatomitis]|uniref:AB hydrolase-1 domain-containing protein n=1 Tax=Penicillium diatomitis TaxID=2819901 RepID=A0A9X0BXR5_9EURO|nr:uncharacterized protein N7539_003649 [Penicillium diatomitis]KAJ5488759.1 hypothetical protein N7539_003649 [Penicillium diatomitis]
MPDPKEVISNSRFHRRISLSTSQGQLSVSFADIGCENGPVILFLPGMFASRYAGILLHAIAEKAGIRLLVIDRPGMGASTDVPLAHRVDTWIEVMPQVLSYLQIQRVSLVSHSAGTFYLLNTWAKCRQYINPEAAVIGNIDILPVRSALQEPSFTTVILLTLPSSAPWVDLKYSRVLSLRAASYIPSKAFSFWNEIPRFFVTQASPVVSASGAFVRYWSPSASSNSEDTASDVAFLVTNWRKVERDYGVPLSEQKELAQLVGRFLHTENTVGANSEAMQCLRKDGGTSWGVCSDYVDCAKALATEPFTLRAYFAETDALIGSKGQQYFENCWRGPGVEAIEFTSKTIPQSDHDTVFQSVEVWEDIFSSFKLQ